MNLLPELDGVIGMGVADEDATPQELYAIGAVFDHIYRGGSPLNCISVFQNEVNRTRPAKIFSCGAFGCGLEEDGTVMSKALSADDDTLPTMDWTYNRSTMDDESDTLELDLYTLEEDGTCDRSFATRDSTLQSSVDGDRAGAARFGKDRSQNDPDETSDEEIDGNATGGKIGRASSRRKKISKTFKFRKQPSDDSFDTKASHLWSGITTEGSPSKSKGKGKMNTNNAKMSSPPRGKSTIDETDRTDSLDENYEGQEQEQIYAGPLNETDETMERLKTWSEVLVAAAKENAPIAMAAAAEATSSAARAATAAATAAGATATPAAYRTDNKSNEARNIRPTASNASNDLTSLVHMLRNTVVEGIPEETRASTTALQAALVRTFNTNLSSFLRRHDMNDNDDNLYSSDGDYETNGTPPRPLNSLAKAMQSMATKEPTRTYAASEQDQVVVRQTTMKSTRFNGSSSSTVRGAESKTTASSMGATIESNETPLLEQRVEISSVSPSRTADSSSRSKQQSNVASSSAASLSGVSRTDTEGIGSHRGDAVSVAPSTRPKIPLSIRMPPSGIESTATVLGDLFISPAWVSSSASSAAMPHRRSFFRRRTSADTTTFDALDKNQSTQNPASISSSSPRRHLPPVPPSTSPTTPSTASPSRNLHLSSNNAGTELSINTYSEGSEGNGTDNATVLTPPRSIADGVGRKKHFSFRKRRTDNSPKDNNGYANEFSPRSSMGMDGPIFQSATNNMSTELCYDDAVLAIVDESMDSNESIVVTRLNFGNGNNETSFTDDVLMTESDKEALGYEVQSV